MITIYHNSRCGKSRCALEILKEKGRDFTVIEYLKDIPTEQDITSLLLKLKLKSEDIIRKKEPVFVENFKGKTFTDKEWISILHDNPILIERPIVVNGDKAIVARPPELVNDIL